MNEPAFPTSYYPDAQSKAFGDEARSFVGMTLRDYFAAKELTTIRNAVSVCDVPEAYARVATHCYRMADAMLEARNGKSKT